MLASWKKVWNWNIATQRKTSCMQTTKNECMEYELGRNGK